MHTPCRYRVFKFHHLRSQQVFHFRQKNNRNFKHIFKSKLISGLSYSKANTIASKDHFQSNFRTDLAHTQTQTCTFSSLQNTNPQCNGTKRAKKSWNVINFQKRVRKMGKQKPISCTETNHLLTAVQQGSFQIPTTALYISIGIPGKAKLSISNKILLSILSLLFLPHSHHFFCTFLFSKQQITNRHFL